MFKKSNLRFCILTPNHFTKIDYCCSAVFYLITKVASISSGIYFGYLAVAGSFGGQVSFESTGFNTT